MSTRVEYYEDGDAAYIYLRDIENGAVARTVCEPPDLVELEFDHEGLLVAECPVG